MKEIYDKLHNIKPEKPVVQKENIEQLEKALGHWKMEEARELASRDNNVQLSEEDLKALDEAKRMSGL